MTDSTPGAGSTDGPGGTDGPGQAGAPGRAGDPGLTPAQARAEAAIEQALAGLGLVPERPQPGSFLVKLPGQRKLATMTWLIVGTQSLHVEAFFCRQPDEAHDRFYRFLLERNGQMYGVHFALDPQGDVYLVGRLPLASVTADEVDRLLGCVLSYSDENFNQALAIGFASSIRREWAWRVKRGESLANLAPFARFASQPGSGE
jgi:putative sensory transduction regulator